MGGGEGGGGLARSDGTHGEGTMDDTVDGETRTPAAELVPTPRGPGRPAGGVRCVVEIYQEVCPPHTLTQASPDHTTTLRWNPPHVRLMNYIWAFVLCESYLTLRSANV